MRNTFQTREHQLGLNGIFSGWATPGSELVSEREQYDFDVDRVPVRHMAPHNEEFSSEVSDYYTTRLSSHSVLKRKDNGEPLAVVSSRYKLVPHVDVVRAFDSLSSKQGTRFQRRVAVNRNGSQMLAEYRFPDVTMEVGKVNGEPDEMEMSITVMNSYDMSRPVKALLGAFRLVCLNGMYLGQIAAFSGHKHTANFSLDALAARFERATTAFASHNERFKLYSETRFSQLAMTLLSDDIEKKLFKVNAAVGKKNRELVYDRFMMHEPSTVWGLYNAATYVASHRAKSVAPAHELMNYADELAAEALRRQASFEGERSVGV